MSVKGSLFLLPNVLGDHYPHEVFLPASVDRAIEKLDGLIAESEKGGRKYLSLFLGHDKAKSIPLSLLRKGADPSDHKFLMEPLLQGQTWGLVSDAGVPCVADPGAQLIHLARKSGIDIKSFVGPSAITISLMLSGLPGQRFAFHGYLPVNEGLGSTLQKLEKRSEEDQATQIFIEAPHRNQRLLEELIKSLQDETWLCVARDLTLPSQKVICQKIKAWRKSPLPNLDRKPSTFLIYAKELNG